jgi:hypothetical protein
MAYLDPRLGNEMLVCGLHCQLQTVASTPGFNITWGLGMAYLDPRLGNEMLVCGLHCQLQTVASTPGFTGID